MSSKYYVYAFLSAEGVRNDKETGFWHEEPDVSGCSEIEPKARNLCPSKILEFSSYLRFWGRGVIATV